MRSGVVTMILAAVVSTQACATVANGTRQPVTVTSEPSSAQVFVNGKLAGTTPLRLDLKRRARTTVLRVEREGFLTREIPLERTVSGWTGGNIVFANPYASQGSKSPSDYRQQLAVTAFGFGLDFLTGAAFKFPTSVKVTLQPGSSPPRAAPR
jgi:hypothetical protein